MLYPFDFEPILSPKPWGGRRLERFGKVLPDGNVGESWEIADLDANDVHSAAASATVVRSGAFAGMTPHELIEQLGSSLMGPIVADRFPLLIKLLDAREHLSVQVHPGEAYASVHEGANLKTESWYVVHAVPESYLFVGFRQGVNRTQVNNALGTPAIVALLNKIPAKTGDIHHIPAGTIHALGAGVLVAEVQTPSDTTFRVYDWVNEYGRPPRQLHLQEAAETLLLASEPRSATAVQGGGVRLLVETPHYWMAEHRLADGASFALRPSAGPTILMTVAGDVHLDTHDQQQAAPIGTTLLVPFGLRGSTSATANVPSTVIEIGFPIVTNGAPH